MAKGSKNSVSAAAALKKLQAGNERFISHDPVHYQNKNDRKVFEGGQQPYAVILSCADSRVSPEIMFNAGLGELFVLRVAGNIADTTTIGSIEYAVSELNTNLIVVIGHEKCGAVNAALANAASSLDLDYNLNSLLSHLAPAVAATKNLQEKNRFVATIKKNAKLQADELRKRSRIISSARGVKIASAYYHLISGKVDFSDLA